jgi:hypothetical protein
MTSYTPLTGNEILEVQGFAENGQLAASTFTTTTGLIAALASSEETSLKSTAITTVGNGVLTAAGLIGGQIVRTGPVAAYLDATATAAAIVALLPTFLVGSTFLIRIKNATAFIETITAGMGVTLPSTVTIAPFSVGNYFATVGGTAVSPTVTLTHMSTTAITNSITETSTSTTALTTVGAGTITAAGIAGGVTLRSGSTSAFTDTTDIATAIISAQPGIVNKIGTSFLYTYVNNTVAVATLTGGTNVTVSGVTVVPANSWVQYLVTYTAAGTITMVGIEQGYFPSSGTFTANGATPVTVTNAAVTAGSNISVTLKTVGGTVGTSAPNVRTITPGTGFTIAGIALDTSTYNYEIRG